jgi:hypothetical protein
MTPRRMKSDRFFTDDFRPEIYTEAGLEWISHNSMKSVILRHHPMLLDVLKPLTNAFAPWHVADSAYSHHRR